jgi:hypothetical protein
MVMEKEKEDSEQGFDVFQCFAVEAVGIVVTAQTTNGRKTQSTCLLFPFFLKNVFTANHVSGIGTFYNFGFWTRLPLCRRTSQNMFPLEPQPTGLGLMRLIISLRKRKKKKKKKKKKKFHQKLPTKITEQKKKNFQKRHYSHNHHLIDSPLLQVRTRHSLTPVYRILHPEFLDIAKAAA